MYTLFKFSIYSCTLIIVKTVFNANWKQRKTNKELYGTYPKYQKRLEIGDNIVQDTAVGVQRNPYLGYPCADQNIGRRKLAHQLLPTQIHYSKIQDWTHPN